MSQSHKDTTPDFIKFNQSSSSFMEGWLIDQMSLWIGPKLRGLLLQYFAPIVQKVSDQAPKSSSRFAAKKNIWCSDLSPPKYGIIKMRLRIILNHRFRIFTGEKDCTKVFCLFLISKSQVIFNFAFKWEWCLMKQFLKTSKPRLSKFNQFWKCFHYRDKLANFFLYQIIIQI